MCSLQQWDKHTERRPEFDYLLVPFEAIILNSTPQIAPPTKTPTKNAKRANTRNGQPELLHAPIPWQVARALRPQRSGLGQNIPYQHTPLNRHIMRTKLARTPARGVSAAGCKWRHTARWAPARSGRDRAAIWHARSSPSAAGCKWQHVAHGSYLYIPENDTLLGIAPPLGTLVPRRALPGASVNTQHTAQWIAIVHLVPVSGTPVGGTGSAALWRARSAPEGSETTLIAGCVPHPSDLKTHTEKTGEESSRDGVCPTRHRQQASHHRH